MTKLVIIDSNAVIHRAYHALPRFTTPKGELVNAVYGFVSLLIRVLKDLKPDYLVAAFDVAGKTFREEKFAEYKAKRIKADQELYDQIPCVKRVLKTFNIPIFEKQGYEADDIIGTITQKVKSAKLKVQSYIVTGDLDTLQLVNDNTKVYTLKRSINDTIIYDIEAVKKRFSGLAPKQMADFKGLRGDPSDNIPGVSGIGEKTAIKLLKKYKNLDNLYSAVHKLHKTKKTNDLLKGKLLQNLIEQEEISRFSKELATINLKVSIKFELEKAVFRNFNIQKVKKLFEQLGFRTLTARLLDFFNDSKQKPASLFDNQSNQPNQQDQRNPCLPKLKQRQERLSKIEKYYKDGILSKRVYEIEKKLVPVIEKMESVGIKLDLNCLEKIGKKFNNNLENLTKRIHSLAGREFNINSPQQLSIILFNKLKLPIKGLRKTPGGVLSTSAPELTKLAKEHKIISLIERYREFIKLKTTYVDSLPKLVGKDKRIHTTFDSLGTATGRMSSKSPNLQNIPVRTQLGRKIRRAFVPEQGKIFLSCDYSQIELRIAALIAKDKKMIHAFKRNEDIHTRTAAEIFDLSLEKVNKEQRRQAKVLNFGVLYGMGVSSFAESAKVSRQKAKSFIIAYKKEFKGISRYIEETKVFARTHGYVETLFGRKRFLPEISSRNSRIRAMAERMAVNHPIQGTAADIIKIAMIKIGKYLETWSMPANNADKQACSLLLQVHDELLFELPEKDLKIFAKKIKQIMENVFVDTDYNAFSKDRGAFIRLRADLSYGKNWGEMKELILF